jgi:outer membrane protein assembly factor BamB
MNQHRSNPSVNVVGWLCVLLLSETPSRAGEAFSWPQFRGPDGSGVAKSAKPPTRIDPGKAAWKTPLPAGKSSPVLWKGRIYVTGLDAGRLATLALDAKSGRLLWKQLAPEVPLESVHGANSPAASTPCVDARGLYVYFGSFGLLCYGHDGRELWRKAIPTPKSMYGVATSPIVHERRLMLVVDDDADLPGSRLSRSKVVAFDTSDGSVVWETQRPQNRGCWSTPGIWRHEQGTDLVVLGNGRAYGYDPGTGAEKWYVTGFAREPIALPVAGGGQLFLTVSMQGGRGDAQLDPEPFWTALLPLDRDGDGRIGRDEITPEFTTPFRPELPLGHAGFGMPLPADPLKRKETQQKMFDWRDKNRDGFWTREEFVAEMSNGQGRPVLAAVRPGGQGDVTESHLIWTLRSGIPEIPSPIYHAGRLYLVRDGGMLSCVNAATGEVIYRERLGPAGHYCASPVIANNHVYLFSAKGELTVVKTGDHFEVAHRADLHSPVSATPAMDRNSLYVRTDDAMRAYR